MFKYLLSVCFAFALVLSCADYDRDNPRDPKSDKYKESDENGGSSSSESGRNLTKKTIKGFVQKGPFVADQTVTVYELDDNFEKTDRSFQGTTNDKGYFEIDVEFDSPYALLEAEGNYNNEVTGTKSAAKIKLYAIADLKDRDSVNVNILTHLEYGKVDFGGKSFKKAKEQALGDVLEVFGIESDVKASEDMSIFGPDDADAALLAVSILLRGNLTEKEFSDRLAKFGKKAWDGEAIAIADWASDVDTEKIKSNIKGWIKSWKLSVDVPNFEKYVYDYWVSSYGLGVCNRNGAEKKNENVNSSHANYTYKCNGSKWEFSFDNSCGNDEKCDGRCYNTTSEFCSEQDNKIYDKCGNQPYNTRDRFCLLGVVTDKCDGYPYEASQFCFNKLIKSKCGNVEDGAEVRDAGEECCGKGKFVKSAEFCQSPNVVLPRCGGDTYTASEFCQEGTDEVLPLCGTVTYDESQRCGEGNIIETRCGDGWYVASANLKCEDNVIKNKCGSSWYYAAKQFCENNTVGDFCGINPQTYDPNKYECKPSINSNGIYLKESIVDEGGNNYNAVLIGEQVWLASDLKYAVEGSKCVDFNEDTYELTLTNTETDICRTIGRLYDWAAAMHFDSSCNTNSCSEIVQFNHKGICPNGWHIPSEPEWTALGEFLEPDAGKKLKDTSTTIWVPYNKFYADDPDNHLACINCTNTGTDIYGFSALPNNAYEYGETGYWWTSTEWYSGDHAAVWANFVAIYGSEDHIGNGAGEKSALYSVRCIKDD